MIKYPDQYKFISLQINVRETSHITNRETYALLEFAGDVGGAFEFVYTIGYLLSKSMLTYKYLALIANRMYVW